MSSLAGRAACDEGEKERHEGRRARRSRSEFRTRIRASKTSASAGEFETPAANHASGDRRSRRFALGGRRPCRPFDRCCESHARIVRHWNANDKSPLVTSMGAPSQTPISFHADAGLLAAITTLPSVFVQDASSAMGATMKLEDDGTGHHRERDAEDRSARRRRRARRRWSSLMFEIRQRIALRADVDLREPVEDTSRTRG